MPILTITLKGTELEKTTLLLLERPYNFTKLKLAHIYHNIDAINFKSAADKSNACQLYIKLGGLVDNNKQIINYSGEYGAEASYFVNDRYDNSDYQIGAGISINNINTQTNSRAKIRRQQAIDIDHLIPIGATKCDTKEIISRDLFKVLHDGGNPINFSGELEFTLYYMDATGKVNPVTISTEGIQTSTTTGIHISYLTMVFDYEE